MAPNFGDTGAKMLSRRLSLSTFKQNRTQQVDILNLLLFDNERNLFQFAIIITRDGLFLNSTDRNADPVTRGRGRFYIVKIASDVFNNEQYQM